MAMLCLFHRSSMCRPGHCALMRSELLDLTTIISATACHQSNYVEPYSRFTLDMVILHRNAETLQALHIRTETWLQRVGLQLKPSKTRIAHTLEPTHEQVSFDFLSFTVRQYRVSPHRSGKNGAGQPLGFKTLIRPSKTAQRRHLQRTGAVIRRHRGTHQDHLITALGPVITGWSRYYAHVASKATFTQMYHRVHHQLRRWVRWRHPHKGYRWRMARYWHRHHGTLVFGQTRVLPRHPETPITRHAKVAGRRSPCDGDWTYWGKRLRHYTGLSPRKGKLLTAQAGRCHQCRLYFTSEDQIEVHHRDGNRANNRFPNLTLLHRHCHDAVHGTHDKSHRIEKLHDRKRSRAVLQRQEVE